MLKQRLNRLFLGLKRLKISLKQPMTALSHAALPRHIRALFLVFLSPT